MLLFSFCLKSFLDPRSPSAPLFIHDAQFSSFQLSFFSTFHLLVFSHASLSHSFHFQVYSRRTEEEEEKEEKEEEEEEEEEANDLFERVVLARLSPPARLSITPPV